MRTRLGRAWWRGPNRWRGNAPTQTLVSALNHPMTKVRGLRSQLVRNGPHTITIGGHTDSVAIRSSRFPSNWELSSARAGSVVWYLQSNGIDSKRLRTVGYADTRPIVADLTPETRAINLRVEITLALPPGGSSEVSR
ncbi:OmpA/MotB family protein [Orrella marina]|uniref:OmpA-like domain-containing protein n=1 Tax=Orrella marina TaxID=2163011 RepID=A0A2R4XIF5_9BURK|nr:OmpA family protein [Orrella marina]AWB33568.1 hypothetical protein DBV39_07430 [Orrella marina]